MNLQYPVRKKKTQKGNGLLGPQFHFLSLYKFMLPLQATVCQIIPFMVSNRNLPAG